MKAIVLSSIPYSDNSYMVRLLTRDKGMVTVSAHTGGKSARMRKSFLLPLTLLEVELTGRENNEVKYIADCRVYHQSNDLIANPIKMLGSQFLCEITEKSIRFQTIADEGIFDFVESSIIELDELKSDVESWIIIYLFGLMQQVGIVPDLSGFKPGMSLDIDEGRVVPFGQNSRETKVLIKTLSGEEIGADFKVIVELMIKYFQRHLEGFGTIKCLNLFI